MAGGKPSLKWELFCFILVPLKLYYWKMQHLIHFSVKFWSMQKYRWCPEVSAAVQRFWDGRLSAWPSAAFNTNCASPSTVFFSFFLHAKPKVINSSSAQVWVQYEPSYLPTLTEYLLKFASLGRSSCLCWNMNLKGAISDPYACLAVSNWSLGPQRSCLERTLSGDEDKSDGLLD